MTDRLSDGDLQALWQSQALGGTTISLEDVRDKARRLERTVARRNLREYIAAAVVMAGCAGIMWIAPSGIIRIGAALVIVGTIFIVYQLHLRGSAIPLPADLAARSALEFHCEQLVRQRDLLRSVWWWYLLPLVPGWAVLHIGQALAHPERVWRLNAFGLVAAAGMVAIYALNRHAAARIQQRIDRLKENS